MNLFKKQISLALALSLLAGQFSSVYAQKFSIPPPQRLEHQRSSTFVAEKIYLPEPDLTDLDKKIPIINKYYELLGRHGNIYNIYKAIEKDYAVAPEYGLTPGELYPIIDAEAAALAGKLISNPQIAKENRELLKEKVLMISSSIILILVLARGFRPITAGFQQGATIAVTGRSLVFELSQKQLWRIGLATMAVEIGLITAAMEPIYARYGYLLANFADYKKLEDVSFLEKLFPPSINAIKDSNKKHGNYAGDDEWANHDINRDALLLLYGIRYLKDSLEKSKEIYKYDIALMEFVRIISNREYVTPNGKTVRGNPGVLFTEEERDYWTNEYKNMKKYQAREKKIQEELTQQWLKNPNDDPLFLRMKASYEVDIKEMRQGIEL